MKKIKFLTFGFFVTVVLNSYGQNNNSTDPLIYDEGVVINGVKWATRNVDKPGTFAVNPEDAGMFYQWNRKVGWSVTDPMINSNGDADWDSSIPIGDTWEKPNDPCPAGWRVPTLDEIKTLFNLNVEWTTKNGMSGKRFIDEATGNFIFLPAVNNRYSVDGMLSDANPIRAVTVNSDGTFSEDGSYGYYWSSTAHEKYKSDAYFLIFRSGRTFWNGSYRHYGRSVRCIAE